jgi:DNA-binding transcriptional LysR family regulator
LSEKKSMAGQLAFAPMQCYERYRQQTLHYCKTPAMTFAWDDLRFVLAVARSGNLASAAASLGVNHSTMFRRLNALEADLGSKLFERLGGDYRATPSGRRMIEAAERMETEALSLDRELSGRDTRLSGQLRVTCSETMAYKGLMPLIAQFRKMHPGIDIDLMVENRVIDMARREADVALRATRPSQGDLFGRKVADVYWGLFASGGYLKANGTPKALANLRDHAVIGWPELSTHTKAGSWLASHVPAQAIGFRASGFVNQAIAARDGLGVALLPVYLAAGEKNLVPVLGRLKDLTTEMWIVTHRSLKDTARVRAFMEHVGDGVKRKLAELSA